MAGRIQLLQRHPAGQKAETAADTLRRKTPVFVTGRLVAHSWRDEADHPHSIVEIEARQVQSL